MKDESYWVLRPDSGGWWLWQEEGTGYTVKLLLADDGSEVVTDLELEEALGRKIGEYENYWEMSSTDQKTMPGKWKKVID